MEKFIWLGVLLSIIAITHIVVIYAHNFRLPKQLAKRVADVVERCNVYTMAINGDLIISININLIIGKHLSCYQESYIKNWYSINNRVLVRKIGNHLEAMGYEFHLGDTVIKSFGEDFTIREPETIDYTSNYNRAQFIRHGNYFILVQDKRR